MIQVYTKDNCPNCTKAKLLLNNQKIDHEELKIGVDIDRETFLCDNPTVRQVPAIFIDEKYIGGYNELINYLNIGDT